LRQRFVSADIVIISAVIAVTAASAAFWILFRVLEWKPHLNYLRLAAAFIMVSPLFEQAASRFALILQFILARRSLNCYSCVLGCVQGVAVCGMHYTGS
jgi:NO-binding membrane sensor protein with MHYT domain